MMLPTTKIVSTVPLDHYLGQAKQYMQNAKSINTRKAYKTDWLLFCNWCTSYQLMALPAASETIIAYITFLAEGGRKVSTIMRRISTIRQAHRAAGCESPTQDKFVRELIQGIRNTLSVQVNQKKPIRIEEIKKITKKLTNTPIDQRDAALLLIGFAGAFRRSELVAIDVEHITYNTQGLEIIIPRSKTDQEGKGMFKAIPYGTRIHTCPVRALKLWLETSKIKTGPIFRSITRHNIISAARLSCHAVSLIIKRHVKRIRLKPSQYSGHSLRAGFVTTAAVNQAPLDEIMTQTGHKKADTVLQYIRKANIFKNNAATKLGL